MFSYLVQVGNRNAGARDDTAAILARYGSQPPAAVLGADELGQMKDLAPEEHAFLDTVASTADTLRETSKAQLVGNVERQAVFADKMHDHLWIRSPAVGGTLGRAVDRYDKFLRLLALYPNKTLAPALDVDLVWHTHQCSAPQYRASVVGRAGRFVDHDDKVQGTAVDAAMEDARRLFSIRFGRQYCICLCWECEAIASALEAHDKDGKTGGPGYRRAGKRGPNGCGILSLC